MKPRTNNLRVAATITEEERKMLDEYIKENDLTISQVIRKALNALFQKERGNLK